MHNPYIKEGKLLIPSESVYAVESTNLDNTTVRDFVNACIEERDQHMSWGALKIQDSKYEFGSIRDDLEKIPGEILEKHIEDINGYIEWGYHREYIITLKEE